MRAFLDFIVYTLNCHKSRRQKDMTFGSNGKQRSKHEMLFGTRFITTFNTIFSTIVENVKTQCIGLVPSLTTINQTTILHKMPYTSPSFQKTNCTLHRRRFQKNPRFTFLLIFAVNELCNVSNKYRAPSNLPSINVFTQGTLYVYSEKILVFFIANIFRNINSLPHFHYFQQ